MIQGGGRHSLISHVIHISKISIHTGAQKPAKSVVSAPKKRRTEEQCVAEIIGGNLGADGDDMDENREFDYMYIGDSEEDSDSDSDWEY